jgi:DNA (cytosine-5)-methyltransferase 1
LTEANWTCHWVSVYERVKLFFTAGAPKSHPADLSAFAEAAVMKSDSHSSAPILIDLFCGAGGLSVGLERAGFRPVLGLDYDRHAISTYAKNHQNTVALHQDISKVSGKEILAAAHGEEIDLIAGGPSCQGYSTHGKRIEDDPRNFLFKHFVRLVREVRPKFFLMENVKGLLTYRGGYFKTLIEDSFASAGYEVISKVVCAADYGVPQLRHRIVFLGTRTGAALSFPEPTHGPADSLFGDLAPYVTVGEALGDLPLLRRNYVKDEWEYASAPSNDFQRYARKGVRSKTTTLHQAKALSPMSSKIVALVKEGEGLRSIPPELLPGRFGKMRRIKDGSLRKDCTTLYFRVSREKPSYTITCHFRNVASGPFVHPVEDRCLTYREAARLMSFQDDYEFEGSMRARQIGNAVPPLLAQALGEHLMKLLKQTMIKSLKKAS